MSMIPGIHEYDFEHTYIHIYIPIGYKAHRRLICDDDDDDDVEDADEDADDDDDDDDGYPSAKICPE